MSWSFESVHKWFRSLRRGHWVAGVLLVGAAPFLPGCISCNGTPCDKDIDYPNPGACHDPTVAAGQPEGKCHTGLGNSCVTGHACVSNTCVPCGEPGDPCCQLGQCNTGTCKSQDSGPRLCDGTCGQLGQPCCGTNDHCANGFICHDADNTCVAAYDPECSGSTTYYVPGRFIDSKCPVVSEYSADSASDATSCAEKGLAELNLTGQVELLTPQTTPVNLGPHPVCKTSDVDPSPVDQQQPGLSAADALSCAQHSCINCTVTAGQCAP